MAVKDPSSSSLSLAIFFLSQEARPHHILSYLSAQDVPSERLEHSGPAHIGNMEAGALKGQSVQPVNGVLCR